MSSAALFSPNELKKAMLASQMVMDPTEGFSRGVGPKLTHTDMYIHIYIEREREREKESYVLMATPTRLQTAARTRSCYPGCLCVQHCWNHDEHEAH